MCTSHIYIYQHTGFAPYLSGVCCLVGSDDLRVIENDGNRLKVDGQEKSHNGFIQ